MEFEVVGYVIVLFVGVGGDFCFVVVVFVVVVYWFECC